MNTQILDGSGKGYNARVSDRLRLWTMTVSEDIASHHAFDGDAYNITTGNITLTSANKSAVLYVKNNEDREIVINNIIYNFSGSTGGSGVIRVQAERNPTAGSIVSNAVEATPINRNFSSPNTLTTLSYKGVEGDTLTGGTVCLDSLLTTTNRHVIAVGAIILGKGASIGLTITPPTSNTSITVQAAMSVYLANETTTDRQ